MISLGTTQNNRNFIRQLITIKGIDDVELDWNPSLGEAVGPVFQHHRGPEVEAIGSQVGCKSSTERNAPTNSGLSLLECTLDTLAYVYLVHHHYAKLSSFVNLEQNERWDIPLQRNFGGYLIVQNNY